MADTTALKNRIRAAIKANDNQEITGPVLQQALLDMVDELNGATETEASQRQSGDSTLQQNINTEAQARQNADNALHLEIGSEAQARQNADTQLNNLITGIKNNIDNGYVYAGIATPSTNPVSGKVFYVAVQAGTYTNFGNTTVTQGINILKYNGSVWSNDVVIGIDNKPAPNSKNLIESGTVSDYTRDTNILSLKENYGYRCGNYSDGGLTATGEGQYACILSIGSLVYFRMQNVHLRSDNHIWISCYSELPTPSNATSVFLGHVTAHGSGLFRTLEGTKYVLFNVTEIGGNVKTYLDYDLATENRIEVNEKKQNYCSLTTDYGYRCGNVNDGGLTATGEGQYACIIPISGGTKFKLQNVSIKNSNIQWISCYSDYPTVTNATQVYLGFVTQQDSYLVTPVNTKYVLFNVTTIGGFVKLYNDYDIGKIEEIDNNTKRIEVDEKKQNYCSLTTDYGYRCGNYSDGGLTATGEGQYACILSIGSLVYFRMQNVHLRGDNYIWISCYSELPTPQNATSVFLGHVTVHGSGLFRTLEGTKYVLFNVTTIGGNVKTYIDYDLETVKRIDVNEKILNYYSLFTDYGYRCGNVNDGGLTATGEGQYACLVKIGSSIKFTLSDVALRGDSRQWISCYSDLPTTDNATSVYLGYADASGDFYSTKENTRFILVNVTALGGLLKVYNSYDAALISNIKDTVEKVKKIENVQNYYGLLKEFDYRCGDYLVGTLTSIIEGQTACILPISGKTIFKLENVSLRQSSKIWISCYSDYPTPATASSLYLGNPESDRGFYIAPENTKYILFNVTSLGGVVKTYLNFDLQPKIWLPEKIYALRGVKLQLFLCGMVEAEFPDNYSMDIQKITGNNGKNLCRMFEWTPGNNSTDLRYRFGYKSDNHLPYTTQASNTDIVVVSKKSSPASNKNILCIGDSFTDADYYPSELKRLLTGVPSGNLSDPLEVNGNDGLTNLTFIGTQDPDFTRNEGYAGKSYHWFVTSDESPFWDSNESDINFTSYCTRNGYSQIDYAIILLGTNTGNDEADIKKMWDKLLAHNPYIKVIVMGRCFANHYGGTGSVGMSINLTWYLESRNVIPLNQRLQEYCKENAYASNFLYVDYNVAFDSLHNMGTIMASANARNPEAQVIQGNDNVHPSKYGYWQIADTVRAAIHYWCL